jgi:hypothetical protein
MLRTIASLSGRASPLLALAATGLGCLCPPCPVTGGPTTAAGAGSLATPSPSPAPTSGSAVPAAGGGGAAGPAPDRLVIWDGDKAGSGQSWADCAKKDQNCKSTFTKITGGGVNGTTGLKWHAEGPDWFGSGWNWFGWWPQGSGTDVSAYASLTFQFKLEAKTPDLAPDGDALAVGLNCSRGDKCGTARVPIHKYLADYADGQWHKVVIPMADLASGDGAAFDRKTTWEFDLNEWSGAPRDFSVYVDDIAFEK